MIKDKRAFAVKVKLISLVLTLLILIVALVIYYPEPLNIWVDRLIYLLISIHLASHGYVMGWDANNKPSTLKGP